MTEIKVVENIMKLNDSVAAEVRALLAERGVFAVNLIGSPGSGKTTLLERVLPKLAPLSEMLVLEGDIATTRDAERIAAGGIEAVQITTGNACHIAAHLIKRSLAQCDLSGRKYLLVENVGNLVCPAEFDIGEHAKIVVLSVPEGDDKPLKYPLVFQTSALCVLTKIDLVPYTDFSIARFKQNVEAVHPGMTIIQTSLRQEGGFEEVAGWLRSERTRLGAAA
ncbi:hydrogenase nickel incorporation protein HypB [bacterium]|nr:hydrogenase nickel incorporation protein HypB [bacterium]